MNNNQLIAPELLSPAGNLKNMRYAFAYGADAVYAGQPRYSLRVRNNEFNHENLKIGIDEAHALGKKFYVVCNIQPHNAKLKTFIRDVTPVIEMKPDALIMSDPGLIMMVREHFPHMPVHLSVQTNTVNWASVQFWGKLGVERIVLSRELSLEEIAEIREHCPEMELEVFIHGALCMAYSGRCLLSGYINKRDPNQGACTNACRWEYKVEPAEQNELGQIVEKFDPSTTERIEVTAIEASSHQTPNHESSSHTNQTTLGLGSPSSEMVLLAEAHRPEEKMSAFEDEHGTYIMNSKDLRAIEHVEQLTKIGVHSLKIEGRTKSFYYCAMTAQKYRRAIDDAMSGKPFDTNLLNELESLANRGYTEGFLRRHSHDSYQNYEHGYSVSTAQQFVGEFTGVRRDGLAEVDVKNKFEVGDSLELMTPAGNVTFTLETMENRKKQSVTDAKGNGHFVFIPVPDEMDLHYALLMRNLTTGQDTRNPTGK